MPVQRKQYIYCLGSSTVLYYLIQTSQAVTGNPIKLKWPQICSCHAADSYTHTTVCLLLPWSADYVDPSEEHNDCALQVSFKRYQFIELLETAKIISHYWYETSGMTDLMILDIHITFVLQNIKQGVFPTLILCCKKTNQFDYSHQS